MAKKKAKSKKTTTLSFEESLDQLKQTVSQLENGNLSLSESLEQYEKGIASLKRCYLALNEAQQRIEMLVDLDEEGNLVTRQFNNTASRDLAQGSRRSTQTPNLAPGDLENEYEDDEDEEIESNDDLDDINSLF